MLKRQGCFILILLIGMVSINCKKKKKDDSLNIICNYPTVYIDTVVVVSDINIMDIRTRGFVYLKASNRGIILYKVSDTEYKAFDRESTFKPNGVGCQITVDTSVFFMKDPCSGSKYDFSGNVIQDPASCPLLQFSTSFIDGIRIRIYHAF